MPGKYQYECFQCKTDDATIDPYHFDDVCIECRSYVTKVYLCEDCGCGPSFDGTDSCAECWADHAVADPTDIDNYTKALQAEVARILARRLRPVLSVRQAA